MGWMCLGCLENTLVLPSATLYMKKKSVIQKIINFFLESKMIMYYIRIRRFTME
jgi:hypothetical protein